MPNPKVDVEFVFERIKAFLKEKLNAKLAEIDAEKADGITLASIPEEAYFFEYLGTEVANFDPFVLYGVADMPVSGASPGPGTVVRVIASISVILTDDGNDLFIVNRLLRYQRALKEIFEKGWNSVSGSLKFDVSSVAPFPLKLLGRDQPSRIVGIELGFYLA